jgi:chromosome segregation ATPase
MSNRSTTGQINAVGMRQDDERRRDEARLAAMQNQVDELRQAMREVLSRQGREEELLKHYEGSAAQNRIAIEQFKQEVAQALQARALDETRTRQQMTDLDTRIEDVGRPIRSLQAHVAEMLEAARQKADDSGQYKKRDDELQTQIDHVSAQIDRTAVVSHQLRDSIDALRGEIDGLRRDIIRAEDSVKIVDQEARRRVAEVSHGSENLGSRIDELRSDIGHLFDLIDDTRRSIVHIDPTLEELHGVDVALRQDIARFQAQAVERHEVMLDRLEDGRQEVDARFTDTRQAQEQRFERLIERIEELAEAHRDLGFRIGSFVTQIDELRLADGAIRRDLWVRDEQRVRLRLEQAQQELDLIGSQRRDADGNGPAGPPRPRRQTDH